MLTADGSTFANPPANYYRIARDPQNLAETTAQLFFGVRMQCAKCHNHPFERWTQDDYYSLAAFFARVRQKKDPMEPGPDAEGARRRGHLQRPLRRSDAAADRQGDDAEVHGRDRCRRSRRARTAATCSPTGSPSADNPFFAKSVVNRIWYHLNGKGIVDPVDDFRDSNPSANDELLDALAKDFIGQQVRREAHDPRHHELADVPVERPGQRLQHATTTSISRTR